MSHGGRHVYVSDFDENRIKQNFIFLKRDTVLLAGREGGQSIEGGVVFNDDGANVDFRVEGDTDQNLLFIDASTDRVGIGTASPANKLHVLGSSASELVLGQYENSGGGGVQFRLITTTRTWGFRQTTNGFAIRDVTGAVEPIMIAQAAPTNSIRIDAGGRVGMNIGTPNTVAQLDITSTTRGFLPPRMTTTQRDAISSPPNGLMIYNTTTNTIQAVYSGTWTSL